MPGKLEKSILNWSTMEKPHPRGTTFKGYYTIIFFKQSVDVNYQSFVRLKIAVIKNIMSQESFKYKIYFSLILLNTVDLILYRIQGSW